MSGAKSGVSWRGDPIPADPPAKDFLSRRPTAGRQLSSIAAGRQPPEIASLVRPRLLPDSFRLDILSRVDNKSVRTGVLAGRYIHDRDAAILFIFGFSGLFMITLHSNSHLELEFTPPDDQTLLFVCLK